MRSFSADQALVYAAEIFSSRYKGAEFCIAAGSIILGLGTAGSDLDLVVVHQKLPTAFREAFHHNSMPVEAFVHDYETVQAFIDGDYENARPTMIHMLATGVAIPAPVETPRRLQCYARMLLEKGPERTADRKIQELRYAATDLIEDLKGDRPQNEQRAILYYLYETIGELRLRHGGRFVSRGKHLARSLEQCDAEFSKKLTGAMESAHRDGVSQTQVETISSLLESVGGALFDGYRQEAGAERRKEAKWLRVSA
ncbi:MAG: hypothetical protein QOD40_700 [Alphaproteobacteria bacterium]|jgi:hypothetical protein|nr:hypothetical protein [Alphaproteobacteria bacterium]MEA2991780.1 hypothetical protein [Alphaproteobacteria bacterium]